MSKVAVIAGSSGLVGTELLHQLCASNAYSAIYLLVRKPSGFIHPKVKEHLIDFDQPAQYAGYLTGDVFFSCLGSTRKKTPDKNTYYHIDHDYPLQLAQLASANGMKQFHLISSIGANPSAAGFYLRLKGETERDIAAVPFYAIHIYRPSFLDGKREEKRLLERVSLTLMRVINPVFGGRWKKYRSIQVTAVARAMLRQSLQDTSGVRYYESDEIQALADHQE